MEVIHIKDVNKSTKVQVAKYNEVTSLCGESQTFGGRTLIWPVGKVSTFIEKL